LRRAIDSGKDIQQINITEAMSADFKFINANSLAAEAARIMQESNVYVLIVRDDNGKIEGILKMHDLLQANVV
jgi:arabinose-5-phosphate isomerase